MAAEKNEFQMHNNYAKGKVISKLKNDKLWKNLKGKVPAPAPF